jgi:ankyrin repeat protein
MTALMGAARNDHPVFLLWLLGEGGAAGTLEVRDKDGYTAFVQACFVGSLECAQALAAAGCAVATASSNGSTALMVAARKDHPAVLTWLLGEGGVARMLEARDEYGYTAFHWACDVGQLECAQALAAAGCDVDAQFCGMSYSQGHPALVAWLGELHVQRAAATQRREAELLIAAGEHRAAATVLAKLLRQAPGDAELVRLLADAERRREEADVAADVLARAAEVELLAMEAGEHAVGSSKSGK